MTTICITENTTQQNGSSDSKISGFTDTSLRSFAPTTNYSTDTGLYTVGDGSQKIVMKADLSSLIGATINSATLWLQCLGGGTLDTPTWESRAILRSAAAISTMTWNTYDGSTSWGTAGATNASDVSSALDTGTMAAFSGGVYISFDVSSYVAAIADGTYTDYGFTLTTTSTGTRLFTSDDGSDSARPELVIDYTAGSGEVAGIEVVRTIAGVTH